MTTVAKVAGFAPIKQEGILPHKKSERQIIREEIQRQKQLDKLEEKYNNGEISKFEYVATKWLINLPEIMENIKPQPTFKTIA